MFQTYNVTGANGHTVYNIQARTEAQARREYQNQTGHAAMRVARV